MSHTEMRSSLLTIVNSVSDIGNVYNRQRWALRWEEVLALLRASIDSTTQIRAWMVTCMGHNDVYGSGGELDVKTGTLQTLRTYKWRIQGFMTFNDDGATELDSFALATSVVNAMNLSPLLHDERYHGEQPPAQLEVFDLRQFTSVLCHYTEIYQQLTEVIALKP